MRDAETLLNVIRERGKRKLPLEDVYRQLYNPDLYLRAYGRIYANKGAMTKGVTEETADGMSQEKIDTLIEALRFERYRWTPVRRVNIPKKNGKTRPLGVPTWSDKILQEVIRAILEAYYEPQFSESSHGFRPELGCHTALTTIKRTWKGTKWFIEGDIKGCFDNIDHKILMGILRENIHDNRFLRLIETMLQSGYFEFKKYNPTLSGTPQGGIVSPLLANIYMDRLDKFVENTLLPKYNYGKERRENPEYGELAYRRERARYHKDKEKAAELLKQLRQIPSRDPNDPDYRRLRYIRYADDFLLAFVGPKEEAETVKAQLREFLKDSLNLELSEEKTLVTHATNKSARFLGYDVQAQHCDTKISPKGTRGVNGRIALRIPSSFVEEKCQRYMRDGKTMHRTELINDSEYDIFSLYQSEYRGYVEYYSLAVNLSWLNKLFRVMTISLLKTLATKNKSTMAKMAQKYKATAESTEGPRRCYQIRIEREGRKPLVARFGGISLKRRADNTVIVEKTRLKDLTTRRVELIQRMTAEKCEVCGTHDKVEVHHINKLSNLRKKGRKEKPLWARIMIARRRKTMVLCQSCHDDIHAGRPLKIERNSENTGEPCDAKVSSTVRGRGDGKGL
jgi:group II intron reverse transcriptase/maturase